LKNILCWFTFANFPGSQDAAGLQALELQLPFDESDVLAQYLPHIQRSLGLQNISVHPAEGGDVPEGVVDKDGPLPGEPRAVLLTNLT
jgi:hypothetical protein